MDCEPEDVATVLAMVVEVIEDRGPAEQEALERLARRVDESRSERGEPWRNLRDGEGNSAALVNVAR